MTVTEREMRRALGLSGSKPAAIAERPQWITVTLSVRHPDGGLPFKFEHRSVTISRTLAVICAEKAAMAEGLRVHALLEVRA